MNIRLFPQSLLVISLLGCTVQTPNAARSQTDFSLSDSVAEKTDSSASNDLSAVTDVEATGEPGAYSFATTIKSVDTGCDRYANWWEVTTPDGRLLYRRILAHSHADEQPFTRSGGPVAIAADQEVIVRVHMHPDGYGTQAVQGSVRAGLVPLTLPQGFALELAAAEPQPSGCAF